MFALKNNPTTNNSQQQRKLGSFEGLNDGWTGANDAERYLQSVDIEIAVRIRLCVPCFSHQNPKSIHTQLVQWVLSQCCSAVQLVETRCDFAVNWLGAKTALPPFARSISLAQKMLEDAASVGYNLVAATSSFSPFAPPEANCVGVWQRAKSLCRRQLKQITVGLAKRDHDGCPVTDMLNG